jgi:hypothetical protein
MRNAVGQAVENMCKALAVTATNASGLWLAATAVAAVDAHLVFRAPQKWLADSML